MQFIVNGLTINIPSTLFEYPLKQRIAFQKEQGDILDEMLKSTLQIKGETNREIGLAELQLENCYRGFSFFSGIDLEVLKESDFAGEIATCYLQATQNINEYEPAILRDQYTWLDNIWQLPDPDIKRGSKITFGEFIDSKQSIKYSIGDKKNKWEALLPICAIYFRKKNEAYDEGFLFEGSERLKLMENIPLEFAIHTGTFFDKFSEYVNKTFPVFHNSKGKSGKNLARHFDRWGWVNFLKSVSKTKEFDIQGSGKNSIECARMALLIDVLIYTSESKEYSEASNADQEAMMQRNKLK